MCKTFVVRCQFRVIERKTHTQPMVLSSLEKSQPHYHFLVVLKFKPSTNGTHIVHINWTEIRPFNSIFAWSLYFYSLSTVITCYYYYYPEWLDIAKNQKNGQNTTVINRCANEHHWVCTQARVCCLFAGHSSLMSRIQKKEKWRKEQN